MTDIVLHFAPDTCSRVPMIALEETGHPYRTELVAFLRGDHKTASYVALNAASKVPALVVDGRALAENVAILLWLAQRFPEAELLPDPTDPLEKARIVADLAHCASNLHPIVTRLRIPQYFATCPKAFPASSRSRRLACTPISRRSSAGWPTAAGGMVIAGRSWTPM